MGREAVNAFSGMTDIILVGAVVSPRQQILSPIPENLISVPVSSELDDVIKESRPDVMIDFTSSVDVLPAIRSAAVKGVNMVIGTTGFSDEEINEMEQISHRYQVGILVAPNFALGAVLMMHLTKIASNYMKNVEILELHHNRKKDAPSGTALSTARTMTGVNEKEYPDIHTDGSRSRGDMIFDISMHSIRLPGLMARQETILSAPGQTLTVRHEISSRECYIQGIILAIREVVKSKDFTYGLDRLLNL